MPAKGAVGVVPQHRIFEIEAGKKPSGADALRVAFIKYNWTLPDDLKETITIADNIEAAALQTGSATAQNLPNDQAYLVNVKVGKETLLLNMDTGSSDLWVFSSGLPKSQRGSHKLYQLEGALVQGETWDIEYPEGSGRSLSCPCR
jgi:hypothetical protein